MPDPRSRLLGFFFSIATNVNYVAYDDIVMLNVVPGFDTASWAERWERLTVPFPEHRQVFSRLVILFFYYLFGTLNMVWLMVVGNLCWTACIFILYKAFTRFRLSLWYFVPVVWIWFNIQSFENIFWGTSSLCNFGVFVFSFLAMYAAAFHPGRVVYALFFSVFAAFTYGNGLFVFLPVATIYLLSGRVRHFLITLAIMGLVLLVYFRGSINQVKSMDLTDPGQLYDGIRGFLGFIGAIATVSSYGVNETFLYAAVCAGFIMVVSFVYVFRGDVLPVLKSVFSLKPSSLTSVQRFVLGLAMFLIITVAVVVYKRISMDGFEGMFKGRYRMYSTLALVTVYITLLPSLSLKSMFLFVFGAIAANLTILYSNFAFAVNNRRMAVIQEFNSRYNEDLLGLAMFDMDQAHFEKIRSYYASDDPLVEGWEPRSARSVLPCADQYPVDTIIEYPETFQIRTSSRFIDARSDYTDGGYFILKSDSHVYAAAPNQTPLPLKTFFRMRRYFNRGAYADFPREMVKPGHYSIYLLIRENGRNKLYCTGRELVKR